MIGRDWFIKAWDPIDKRETFQRIIGRGQSYPTEYPVKTLELAATHDDQERLGMEVFDLGEDLRLRESLVVDDRGRLHLSGDAVRQLARRKALNAERPRFILSDPPCARGERRFQVAFGIDAEGWLTVSVSDRSADGRSKLLLADGTALGLPVADVRFARLCDQS